MRVTDEQIEQLKEQGYVLVPGFVSRDELAGARKDFLNYFPTAEQLEKNPGEFEELLEEADAGQMEFPFAGDALNDISTHPDLIELVARLLGTDEVMLSQSAIWAKYAGAGAGAADYEQGLHLDYQGNTLVAPRDDGDYRQVNMILYYTDVTPDLGPTYVVPQPKTRELPLWPAFKPRKQFPELYTIEQPILASAGSLLIFSMRTFHRASSITASSGARFSHHLVWRSARHNFQGYHLWAQKGEDPNLQRFVERATPRQREVLGFPRPGDRYWTKETLGAVQLRYPKMDLRPYSR